MKKSIALMLVVCLLFPCVSCKTDRYEDEELNKVIPSSSPIEHNQITLEEKSDADGYYKKVRIEKTNEQRRFYFNYEDLSDWDTEKKYMNSEEDCAIPHSFDYSLLMRLIGENGIVVTGKAYGERRGFQNIGEEWGYTVTNFKIEKLLHGSNSSKTIQIYENYCPIIEKDRALVKIANRFDIGILDNNQTVLLFLEKVRGTEYYQTDYVNLVLQDDYADYNEETLTELLDFYRGKEWAYKPWRASAPPMRRWPENDLSNEEIGEMYSDNVIVQLAVKHHIIMWPVEHVNFKYSKLPREVTQALYEHSLAPY